MKYLSRGTRVALQEVTALEVKVYQHPGPIGLRGKVLVRQGQQSTAMYMVKWDDGRVTFEPRPRLLEVS